MKQAYLINRKINDNSYNIFRIANSNSIEMIDLFTINFNNKEELVNYLSTLSSDISDNDDLYLIIKDGRNNIKVYDILYSGPHNNDIEKACMNSLSKKEIDYYGFNDKWFVFGDYEPLTFYKMQALSWEVSKLAEIRHLPLHGFRHSCASLLINTGQPPTTVSNYLGHASVKETLDTYSHMFPNNLINAKMAMDNLNKSI